jgi:hypothetical protein
VPVPVLWSPLDPEEGGLHGAVGGRYRTRLEPRPSRAFERAIVGHASRPPWTIGSASIMRASRSPAMA